LFFHTGSGFELSILISILVGVEVLEQCLLFELPTVHSEADLTGVLFVDEKL